MSATDNPAQTPPNTPALEHFKGILQDPANTEQELSLLGLHLDLNQQAHPATLINQLLTAQETGNATLTEEYMNEYTINLLTFGEHLAQLPKDTTFPEDLINRIRTKADLTALGVQESDRNGLQDALEIATIKLATEAIGPVYALLLDQTYPDRRTTGFDKQTIRTTINSVGMTTPQDLHQLVTSKNIPLSPSTSALLNNLAHPTNPLMHALAGAEFTSMVETTKAGLLHLATTYIPPTSNNEPALGTANNKGSEVSEVPQAREASSIDALITAMASDTNEKSSYDAYIAQITAAYVQEAKTTLESIFHSDNAVTFEQWWTTNTLDQKITDLYIKLYKKHGSRETFVVALRESGAAIKQTITPQAPLHMTKTQLQTLLFTDAESMFMTETLEDKIEEDATGEIETLLATCIHPNDMDPTTRLVTTPTSPQSPAIAPDPASTERYTPTTITYSDTRTSSVAPGTHPLPASPSTEITQTPSPHSGHGLGGIFAGLGIIFGTLYRSNKSAAPESEGGGSFWGKMGKMGLIGLALTGGVYGAYKAYDYYTNDKKGGNAQGGPTASAETGPLYPIPTG